MCSGQDSSTEWVNLEAHHFSGAPEEDRGLGRGLWKFMMITFIKKFLDLNSGKLVPLLEYNFPVLFLFSFLSVSPSPFSLESVLQHVFGTPNAKHRPAL